MGFNPRPRTGSDEALEGEALALEGFNPRPRTGSDEALEGEALALEGFNPRPRTGSDRRVQAGALWVRVSIHAPARGATCLGSGSATFDLFQSTPPHGERPRKSLSTASPCSFQSTPPHGERPRWVVKKHRVVEFQSTPPHGERLVSWWQAQHLDPVSIHAPARGATCRR